MFQRAAGAVALADDGMQLVVLKDFGKIFQRPLQGHQGKAGQILVFEHVVVEGGEQLAGFHKRVALVFLIRLDKAETDMYRIEKAFQGRKIGNIHRLGKCVGITPRQPVLAEDFFPFDHDVPVPSRPSDYADFPFLPCRCSE